MTERVLTLRELNRTLLVRQLLSRRRPLPVARAVERLGALQAQWSNSPYVALWSRLDGFERDDLTRALHRRSVVKATLMRHTLHLVSGGDYLRFSEALRDSRRAWVAQRLRSEVPDLDVDALAERVLAAVGDRPRLREEYFAVLDEQEPKRAGMAREWLLWAAIQIHGDLVHAPPSGTWNHYAKSPFFVPARSWLRRPPRLDGDQRAHLARRYLAAFGPASVADLVSWAGSTASHFRPVLEELPLRRFRDEAGRVLLDLPRARVAAEDAPAPVRFLPKWDSALLAHAPPERTRILPERFRKTVIRANGDVLQTVLVDGFVAATWEIERRRDRATLVVKPLAPLPGGVRPGLEEEGERLLRFVEPEAASYSLRLG